MGNTLLTGGIAPNIVSLICDKETTWEGNDRAIADHS